MFTSVLTGVGGECSQDLIEGRRCIYWSNTCLGWNREVPLGLSDKHCKVLVYNAVLLTIFPRLEIRGLDHSHLIMESQLQLNKSGKKSKHSS